MALENLGKHYREECEHGIVKVQCKCSSADKIIYIVDCEEVKDHDARQRSS